MISSLNQNKLINLNGYYAGAMSRFVAFIFDVLIVNIILLLIGWFVSITLALLQNLSILGIDFNSLPYITNIISIITDPFFISIFIFTVIFLYYTFFTVFSGHTPGKAIMGLRIVSTKGKKITFIRSTIRFFAYIPTLLSLGIGFFWIIFDDQRQAWHDTISSTYVIYVWDARPDEKFLKNIFPSSND